MRRKVEALIFNVVLNCVLCSHSCNLLIYHHCFQLHVLSFTLHTLLDKMSDNLSPGDLDSSLPGLVEVRTKDLNSSPLCTRFIAFTRATGSKHFTAFNSSALRPIKASSEYCWVVVAINPKFGVSKCS